MEGREFKRLLRELFLCNLRLAVSIARDYPGPPPPLGNLTLDLLVPKEPGLMRAASISLRFTRRPSRTYALHGFAILFSSLVYHNRVIRRLQPLTSWHGHALLQVSSLERYRRTGARTQPGKLAGVHRLRHPESPILWLQLLSLLSMRRTGRRRDLEDFFPKPRQPGLRRKTTISVTGIAAASNSKLPLLA